MKKLKKKGSFQDVPFALVIFLVLGLVVLLMGRVADSFAEKVTEKGLMGTTATDQFNEYESSFANIWEAGMLIIIVGLALSAILGAFLIRSHPAFFGVAFLILVLFVIIGGVFSNVYEKFKDNGNISTIASEFGIINFIFTKLPLWTLIISLLIAIVMFSKPGGEA